MESGTQALNSFSSYVAIPWIVILKHHAIPGPRIHTVLCISMNCVASRPATVDDGLMHVDVEMSLGVNFEQANMHHPLLAPFRYGVELFISNESSKVQV